MPREETKQTQDSHPKRRAGIKYWTVNIFLTVASVLICLLAVELVLRYGIIDNTLYRVMQPDGDTRQSSTRVLILGDSFLYSKYDLYQILLKELNPYPVLVLNTAQPGMGPYEYLWEMQSKGTTFKPDVTLLCYYAGNDLTNVQNHPQFTGTNKVKDVLRPLVRKSYLYNFYISRKDVLWARFLKNDHSRNSGPEKNTTELAQKQNINPWLLHLGTTYNDYFIDNLLPEKKESRQALQKIEQLLNDIYRTCNDINSKLALIIFPGTVQVNDSHYQFFSEIGVRLDRRMLSSDVPQQFLKKICAERNIPVLDLLPQFRLQRETELYIEHDDHLNYAGNRAAAEYIMEFILKNYPLNKS